MAFDFLNADTRLQILKDTKTEENKQRKALSLKQFEIYADRLHPWVVEYLRAQFSEKTVSEMPVVSSINLAKRIVTQEASLYKTRPEREFNTLNPKELEQIEQFYKDMCVDSKMLKSNQFFKLQQQSLLMVVPKDGTLKLRVLLPHHYDVVPDPADPEKALAYIISAFDKSFYLRTNDEPSTSNNGSTIVSNYQSDGVNQTTADAEDYLSVTEKYVWWTKDFNFITDGKGQLISPADDMGSPLASLQMMPFVDIAADKDFEYFVRQGSSLSDFTIQYCGALSDLGNVVKMQGWAQAWMKGPKELMPESIQIGPNFILKLPIDENKPVPTDFGYANPSPDVAGSIQYVEMLLSNFLTSRGQSPKIVSGKGESENYASGIERLLAMIEKFDASQLDMEVYRKAESELFEIVKAWNNLLSGSLLKSSVKIADDTNVEVKFAAPQAIQSRQEQLVAIQLERELGLKSRLQAIEELYDVDEEKAKQIIAQIDSEDIGNAKDQGTQTQPDGSQPTNKP